MHYLFKFQIHYTKLNGSKCIRVISKKKAITNNRETAESKVNVAVVGVHAVQQTAKLVQKGLYGKAKMKSLTNTKLLERSAKSDEQKRQVITFRNQSETLEKEISKAKKRERSMGVTSDSDEDDLSDEDKGDIETEKIEKKNDTKKIEKFEKSTERARSRKSARTDTFSNTVYQSKWAKSSKY